jgi:hypothetical protein
MSSRFTSNFVIRSFFPASYVDKAEERLVKREGSSKGCHFIGVLEDARASQLMKEAFHVVKYLNHDIVARCIAIRITLCNMFFDLIMQFLDSVGATISTSLVKIIMELIGQKSIAIAV